MLKQKQNKKLNRIDDPKFKTVVPNMPKVIYAWDKKILSISINSHFSEQYIHNIDHIVDIHVNTEVLTTGIVIPSGTKRPSAVAST